ncbi:MAG: hypothetical protein Q9220_007344 [cf. Caloplaca sp. 1 TL-2023]
MHFSYTTTTLLTLALSAAALPQNATSDSLTKRFGGEPSIASFSNGFCSGPPLEPHRLHHGINCIPFTPLSDNVGINWSNVRALGINFYTDTKCKQYATGTLYASLDPRLDNGKGKADKCISYKLNGGNWKSVEFIGDSGSTELFEAKQFGGKAPYKGGKVPG